MSNPDFATQARAAENARKSRTQHAAVLAKNAIYELLSAITAQMSDSQRALALDWKTDGSDLMYAHRVMRSAMSEAETLSRVN